MNLGTRSTEALVLAELRVVAAKHSDCASLTGSKRARTNSAGAAASASTCSEVDLLREQLAVVMEELAAANRREQQLRDENAQLKKQAHQGCYIHGQGRFGGRDPALQRILQEAGQRNLPRGELRDDARSYRGQQLHWASARVAWADDTRRQALMLAVCQLRAHGHQKLRMVGLQSVR